MKKICRELMKKNNELEKQISKSNDEIYTDMIVYIRCSDLTEYNQELVREDLINMIIDGQNRGEDIEKVMGGNYKEVCDEIIDAMPKKTLFQKIMSGVSLTFTLMWIVGLISIVKLGVVSLIKGDESWKFILSCGDIINMVLIIAAANFIVKYVCKNSFEKVNKKLNFLKEWIAAMIMIGILILSALFLKYTVVSTSFLCAIVTVAVIFLIDKVFSLYVDEKVL